MGSIVFPEGFPKEIIQRYEKRKYRFTTDGKQRGTIIDCRFFQQTLSGNRDFWKGIEKVKFDTERLIEYRFCYWAKVGDGWKWGRFCPFFPSEMINDVLAKFNATDGFFIKK